MRMPNILPNAVLPPAGPVLDGATVLVTGASSGIGRELAIQLGSRAATLVLVARRAERLDALRRELLAVHPQLKVVVNAADLSDEHDLDRLLAEVHARVGVVDVLVNNAGIGDEGLFDRADWNRTRTLLGTNVIAVARLTAAFVPAMVARGRGGVLTVGSGAGLTIMPAAAAYCASKHFVAGFCEALRADLSGTGVIVTQACPGPVDTEFDHAAGSDGGMAGGPPQLMRIGAAQCAREAIAGFDRAAPAVFPGRAYRLAMRILPLVPRALQRRQAGRVAARLRTSTSPTSTDVTGSDGPGQVEPARGSAG